MFDKPQINNLFVDGSYNLIIQDAKGTVTVQPLSDLVDKLTESHTRRISDLEIAIHDKSTINEYNLKEINDLRKQLEKEIDEKAALTIKVENLLKSLSKQDLSEASEAHQASVKHLIQGNIEGAIAAIEDSAMDGMIADLGERENELDAQKKQVSEALFFKSQLLVINNDFDGALVNALKAAKLRPTVKNFLNANNLSYLVEDFKTCQNLIEKALEVSENDGDLSQILYEKSTLLLRMGNYGSAKIALEKAIVLHSAMAPSNQRLDIFSQQYAAFAKIERANNNQEKALEFLQRALNIQKDLVKLDPEKHRPGLASALQTMAKHYVDNNRPDLADPLYKESLAIFLTLASESKVFLVSLAHLYHEMGVTSRHMGYFEDAKSYYNTAIDLSQDSSFHTLSARSLLGNIWNSLGTLYLHCNHLESADEALNKSLEIRRERMADNPEANWGSLIESLNTVSVIQKERGKLDLAEKNWLESLSIIDQYQVEDSPLSSNTIARIKHNLAGVYLQWKNYPEAKRCIIDSIDTRRKLASKTPVVFEPLLARSLATLGEITEGSGDNENAKSHYLEALALQRNYASSNRDDLTHFIHMAIRVAEFYQLKLNDKPRSLDLVAEAVTSLNTPSLASVKLSDIGKGREIVERWDIEWSDFLNRLGLHS
ncbi:hypothetical protein MUK70_12750 [Dyadobacter chenwenxiniae]|uniref:Tetratricopeptide repeat protein n=1 Tax=Dyadobacter chenwenxiniae TaxID=2906456 RepID=A0A9X1PF05_9BACT|nr:hypothetical protein [Dyadobacter chenwenxiniae]MCF0060112.1 hypothetical protein [Dyadobacter chenwenxiniae]UON85850.1 hypothetical protein MUK70_12750 [Dyadobacter chenwenxiniae]